MNGGNPLPGLHDAVLYAVDGKVYLTRDDDFYNITEHTDATLLPDVHAKTHKPLVFYYVGVSIRTVQVYQGLS